MIPKHVSPFVLLLLAGGATAGLAEEAVLGPDGVIYRAVAGPYSEPFEGHTLAEPDAPVLALELCWQAWGTVLRMLVPGTEGSEVESDPSLYVGGSDGTLYVVWESRVDEVHSRIQLITFDGSSWSSAIEVTGEPFGLKSAPQVVATQENFTVPQGTSHEDHERTILHLVWWEQSASGDRVVYSPLLFVDGEYSGANRTFVLADFDDGTEIAEAEPAIELVQAPALIRGSRPGSVVAAVANPRTNEIVSYELLAVPGELGELAEELARTLDRDPEVCRGESGTTGLIEKARAHIILIGSKYLLRQSVAAFLSQEVSERLSRAGASSCDAPGDRVRDHLLDASVDLHGEWSALPEKARAHIILIGSHVRLHAMQKVAVRALMNLPLPETDAGPKTLLVSPRGYEMIVAWQSGEELRYREGVSDGWSGVRTLEIGSGLTLDEALAFLRQRIASH